MADWIELLHQNIKIECGRGWLVTPQGRKTKVWRRLAKGLGANNPRSCCNLDIPFKQENAPLIRDTVKRLNDLTRNAEKLKPKLKPKPFWSPLDSNNLFNIYFS